MYLDDFTRKASNTLRSYPEPVQYLESRGIDSTDIDHYQVGYVRVARIAKSSSPDYQLLRESTNGFRGLQNRILFPLRNVSGHVHGIVARSLEHKRYIQYFLNEAKKTGAFFGLFEALPSILQTKKVFVHEGAFDSISFAKVFPNSVSSLTSFLNEQQYELLRFFADKIVLVYDKDKSGFIGIRKMTEAYGERYIDHVFLGDNDANSYLRTMGLSSFKSFLKTRIPRILQN